MYFIHMNLCWSKPKLILHAMNRKLRDNLNISTDHSKTHCRAPRWCRRISLVRRRPHATAVSYPSSSPGSHPLPNPLAGRVKPISMYCTILVRKTAVSCFRRTAFLRAAQRTLGTTARIRISASGIPMWKSCGAGPPPCEAARGQSDHP